MKGLNSWETNISGIHLKGMLYAQFFRKFLIMEMNCRKKLKFSMTWDMSIVKNTYINSETYSKSWVSNVMNVGHMMAKNSLLEVPDLGSWSENWLTCKPAIEIYSRFTLYYLKLRYVKFNKLYECLKKVTRTTHTFRYKIWLDKNCPNSCIFVFDDNSNLIVPMPLIVTSSSESKSKEPAVSIENIWIFE